MISGNHVEKMKYFCISMNDKDTYEIRCRYDIILNYKFCNKISYEDETHSHIFIRR